MGAGAAVSAYVLRAETGIGSAVLGNPLQPLVWLANCFAEQGRTLAEGDLIMTGSITPVYWMDGAPNHTAIEISQVGTCELNLS